LTAISRGPVSTFTRVSSEGFAARWQPEEVLDVTANEKARESAEAAAEALAPDAGILASADAAGLGEAMLAVLRRAAMNPSATASATLRYWTSLATAGPIAAARWLGVDTAPPVPVPERDKRFADPTWTDNPAFFAIRQGHLAVSRLVTDLLEAGAGNPVDDAKAQLAAGFAVDALSPTNFLLTNPAALKRMLETGGASLVAGAGHFVDDMLHNNGRPRQVDSRPFRVGENLAATPGQVVFKNDLMELIQYAPQTPKVRAVPVLASPPWINKYYVMDLAPNRSFLEWAIQHERTVFAISYRNPDASMGGITLDDYLIHGPREALDVIAEITGAPKIDIIGLCLGGALTSMLAAYLTEKGDDRLGSITLLNTLLDYSDPGVLGAFTDEKTVQRLEKKMAEKGVLEGSQMAGTFDMLRANELIFNYVVSNWLMGQDPPAFDILAWNGDSTRMPSAMHSFYLRSLYMRNELATGELELAGQQLSLSSVTNDTYVVGAINDHIVPWHGSYKTGGLMGGKVRYVLSSGGHIAGIVNPPGPKAWYEAADFTGADPETWRQAASKHKGSWWEDWTVWADERAGALVKPPAMGSKKYPAVSDAPGEYVLG
jgi:polyhydroxyalkanoate synthase